MIVRLGGICGLLAVVLAVANVAFSAIGNGAAVRGGTVVSAAWIAFVGAQLLRKPHVHAQP